VTCAGLTSGRLPYQATIYEVQLGWFTTSVQRRGVAVDKTRACALAHIKICKLLLYAGAGFGQRVAAQFLVVIIRIRKSSYTSQNSTRKSLNKFLLYVFLGSNKYYSVSLVQINIEENALRLQPQNVIFIFNNIFWFWSSLLQVATRPTCWPFSPWSIPLAGCRWSPCGSTPASWPPAPASSSTAPSTSWCPSSALSRHAPPAPVAGWGKAAWKELADKLYSVRGTSVEGSSGEWTTVLHYGE
jgi:hypothetical protein